MSANETSLLLKIRGDAAQLKSELGGASKEVSKFAADTSKSVSQALKEIQKANQYKATSGSQSATDFLIAESQKAIANAEKLSASATSSVDRVSSRLAIAQREASSLGAGVSSLATDLALVVGPAAAVTAGFIAVSSAIYGVASAAAESAGHIKDLSDQTGFSAKSLSALANAAEKSGGNIDSIAASLNIFEGNMEKANEEGSKQSELFRRLNIDTQENEKALRQAIAAIAAQTDEYKRNALAKDLFGKAGKQLAGIIRDEGGDLDALIARYEGFRTLVGTEAANAADVFGDTQIELRQQLKASEREFGEQFYPVVIKVMSDLTDWLRENQGAIKEWGEGAAYAIKQAIAWSETIGHVVASANPMLVMLDAGVTAWKYFTDAVKGATDALREEASVASTSPVTVPPGTAEAPRPTTQGLPTPSLDSSLKVASQEYRKAIKDAETDYRRGVTDIESLTKRRINAAENERDVVINAVTEQTKVINGELKKQGANFEALNDRLGKLSDQRQKAEDDFNERRAAALTDKEDKINAAQRQRRAAQERALQTLDQSRISQIKAQESQEVISHEEAARQIEAIESSSFGRRKAFYESELRLAGGNLEAQTAARNALAQLDAERTAQVAEQSNRRVQAQKADDDKRLRDQQTFYNRSEETANIYDRSAIARIQDNAEKGKQTYKQAEESIINIQSAAFVRRKQQLDKELTLTKAGSRERADVEHQLDVLSAESTAFREELARRRVAAEEKDLEVIQKRATWLREETQNALEALAAMNKAAAEALGPSPKEVAASIIGQIGVAPGDEPPINVWFDKIGTKIADVFGLGSQQAQAFGGIMTGTFNMIGQSVGSLIQNWVMLGKASNVSMGQLVKSVLAGVASMAAVQAIYELAVGIAALTPWGAAIYGPAAMHFKSAALLGGIALGAGVLGRVTPGGEGVAGQAFTQNNQSTGSVPAGKGLNSPEQDRTIREARYGQGSQSIDVNINMRHDDGTLERQVVRVWNNNGSLRATVLNETTGGAFAPV